ncbi:mannose-1-phosphate guanylyltransferase 1 [bacterium BMS3Abin15]|nr:mannose-1-phosphate guanylyltransferase 1 [bacterium BMS3Abin15]HDZ85827.1 mannose-1-phosphate guanylyltransferase [Candidatus Moranbacteria bacterium]
MYSVILCGGSGTRLWPLSRQNFPKQFLNLYGDYSLLQETFLRMQKIIPADNIFLVTNKDGLEKVFNQIRNIYKKFRKDRILIEPASLNTAPAITYAVKYLADKIKISANDPIIFLPSDHYIGKEAVYLKLVKKAMSGTESNIGTIGITPTGPETGFGYIKKGKKQNEYFKVSEFKEKPNEKTAQKYVKSGKYVWNSGMYIFNIDAFTRELQKYAPEMRLLLKNNLSVFLKKFKTLPSISIDYALSEKSKRIVVFEGDFGWSDIGSFDSLAKILEKYKIKNSNHINIDSENIFIQGTGKKLIATLGVEDLIIVETDDSILIQKKGKSDHVRKVVEHLKKNKSKEL